MPLFSINNNKLEKVRKTDFKLERDLQIITEDNLDEIFGLELVKSEFQINNLRIDSLAFDNESNSFVIIEYKRGANFSVIDQGYAYLALLLNNKAEFILEYNERMDTNLRRDDVDWSQSRVVFVAPQFTTYQRKAIEFKDMAFELWEVSKYDNDIILYNEIKSPETSDSITTVSKQNKVIKDVVKEVKKYNEEDHLQKAGEEVLELYEEIKERILEFDSLEMDPKKVYIAFKAGTNVMDIRFARNHLTAWINMRQGTLEDPKKITRDVSAVSHNGNGDYELKIQPGDDLNYLMYLVGQSYKKNSS
jgi:predicted transport protein